MHRGTWRATVHGVKRVEPDGAGTQPMVGRPHSSVCEFN